MDVSDCNIEYSDELIDAVRAAKENILPKKSIDRYEKAYDVFYKWRLGKNIAVLDENILLAYIYEKSKILKQLSLWTMYSMLKSTLKLKENIDISGFAQVNAFMKRGNDSYVANKSSVLSVEHVKQFLRETPDIDYLVIKVAMIFGLHGACRRGELYNIMGKDIVDTGSIAVVTLNDTKTKRNRIFTVTEDCDGYSLYRTYHDMRPNNIKCERFFLMYNKGKCSRQVLGIQSFGQMPKKVAELLKLPNSHTYTGHCFRRTSATFLADSGVDICTLKRHSGWKYSTVAEGYIEDSVSNKVTNSRNIFQHVSHELSRMRLLFKIY